MRVLALAAVLCACVLPRAAGQSTSRWLVVPTTTTPDASWVQPTASSVRTELVTRGVDVWPLAEAARNYEENGAAPPARVTESEVRAWVTGSDAAVEHLVNGAPAKALEQLRGAQAFSRDAVEVLNRDEKQSQRLLDACLYGVRALTEIGARADAQVQARECRQLVPAADPSPHMHPPDVLALLQQVDAALAQQTGGLMVSSEPTGCTARVNGLVVGETPVEVNHLFPARYRIQVECDPDRPGLVHKVEVGTGLSEVFVDLRFEGAVETRPILRLDYASPSKEEEHRDADAAQIAKVVPADSIVLMSMLMTGAVELDLQSGTPLERTALVRIRSGPSGPTRGDIALAASTLIDGKCMDLTTTPSVPLTCAEGSVVAGAAPHDDWPPMRRPRGQFISGLTLVGIGSASLLTGYALLGPRARAGEDWVNALDASEPAALLQQRWYNLSNGIVATSSAGAAALVTAMPLALPNRARTPWWAWLSGGVGLGLAAFSIAYGIGAEPEPGIACSSLISDPTDARTCVKRIERTSLAVATGVTAAPLLTIPLVYLLRPTEAKITPNVEVSRSGGYVGVRGQF